MTLKEFMRVEAFATANAFVFDFGGRRGDHRYIYRLLICLRNHLIRLVGFERTPIRFWHDGMTHKYPRLELLAFLNEIREVTAARIGTVSFFGLWLSLVERLVRDQEAVGSNPTSPIDYSLIRYGRAVGAATDPGFKFHQPD